MLIIPKHLEPEFVKRCMAVPMGSNDNEWERSVKAEIIAFARENSVRLRDDVNEAFKQFLGAL